MSHFWSGISKQLSQLPNDSTAITVDNAEHLRQTDGQWDSTITNNICEQTNAVGTYANMYVCKYVWGYEKTWKVKILNKTQKKKIKQERREITTMRWVVATSVMQQQAVLLINNHETSGSCHFDNNKCEIMGCRLVDCLTSALADWLASWLAVWPKR